ncbi:MAG: M48 family metallopeptidase [Gallionellaceae bacterium]|nr:M48 family metallopeptidase [Gallionellaceae bacterium]
MNFFEAQARAKQRTGWLLLLFTLAVAGIVVLVNLLVMAVIFFNRDALHPSPPTFWQRFDWQLFGMVGVATLVFIGLGSLYKMLSLSGGGSVVAEMLGGSLVPRNTDDPAQRRLINVVEEMAIASGIPAPPVYLLGDMGINAFAAGFTPYNAVIGVTRGAITYLSRDELQGVIAHEFSHVFNGDMRMNIRLMGVLHGILLIGLTGYYLLRAMRYTSGSRSRNGGNAVAFLLILGGGLVVIGYAGFFFGQWIKASVSRQREFLADASAVQFTRNRDGIAGALKKIGGSARGSQLDNASAQQYCHAYFSDGVGGFMEELFATHPPLEQRIKLIDRHWDGKFVAPKVEEVAASRAPADIATARMTVLAGAVLAGVLTPDDALATVGKVSQDNVDRARDILASIPDPLRQAAADPFGARAVIFGMLLDNNADILSKQLAVLAAQAEAAVTLLAEQLHGHLPNLPAAARLPLADLALPSLRTLSKAQYDRFRAVVKALIAADNKVNLNEWTLTHFLMRQLDQHFGLQAPTKARFGMLGDVNREAALLISLVAHAEHQDDADAAARAFSAGIAAAGATALKFVPHEELKLEVLDVAVDKLAELKPLLKPRIIKACAATIMHDGQATIRGHELLRTIASCLDTPMPPLPAPE